MARKLMWLLLLVLLLAAGWWWRGMPTSWQTMVNGPSFTDHESPSSLTAGPTLSTDESTPSTIANPSMAEATPSSNQEHQAIPGSDWQQKLLQEIEHRQFSDDPYVEILSMEYVLGQCRDQDVVDRLFVGRGTFYQSQQQLANDLQQHCQQVRQQYPEYFSYPDHEALAQAFAPNSRLGQLLKQQKADGLTPLDRRALSSAILRQSIQERNGATLLEAVFVTRFGTLPNEAMAQVLGSRDAEYINQMSSLALMMLSCQYQDGRSCEATSFYMIIMCSQTPAACGMDFPSWLEATTLPGMRRDIDLLVAHFSQYGS